MIRSDVRRLIVHKCIEKRQTCFLFGNPSHHVAVALSVAESKGVAGNAEQAAGGAACDADTRLSADGG